MIRDSVARFLVVMTAVVAVSTPATATVVVPSEFREVVEDSALIVRGVVTDIRVAEVRGEGVFTVGTIAVEVVLKGQVTDRVVFVRVPGGERGRYRVVMPGAPELRSGERAVFFLKRGADAVWIPVGLAAGVVRVDPDPRNRRAVVVAPPVLLGTTASVGSVRRGDVRRPLLSLGDFESIVRTVMATNRGRPGGTR